MEIKLFLDGDSYCVLSGADIQVGICGFGDTPLEAYQEFAKQAVAVIQDRDKTLSSLKEQTGLASVGFDNMVITLGYADEENTILREALDRIDYLSKYYAAKLSCHMDKDTMEPLKLDPIVQEFADIVRETLTKVGEQK